jgi:hypothetical protein
VYQNYELRRRASRKTRLIRSLTVLAVIALGVTSAVVFLQWGKVERPVSEVGGIKQISTVKDTHLAVYDGTSWNSRFWTGMNRAPRSWRAGADKTWEGWEQPTYHERNKKSYAILSEAFKTYERVRTPPR